MKAIPDIKSIEDIPMIHLSAGIIFGNNNNTEGQGLYSLTFLFLEFFLEFYSFLRIILRTRIFTIRNVFKSVHFCLIEREIENHILITLYINHL